MREAVIGILIAGLLAGAPAAAQKRDARPAAAVEKPESGKAKSPKAEKAATKPAAGEPAGAEVEVQRLRQMVLEQARELEAHRAALAAQQALLEKMEQRLAALHSAAPQRPAGQPVSGAAGAAAATPVTAEQLEVVEGQIDAVAEHQAELGKKVGEIQTDLSNSKKATEGKLRQLGNFSFSGDLRVRGEPFHGGTLSTPRIRQRFRLRFNVAARFSEELSGGFGIASGDATDPISTNQTFTSFFQRKFVGINTAFLRYRPKWFQPLELVGGKFGATWYRTEMTLDGDTNPEGFSQLLTFKTPAPALERIVLVGFQLPFNERSSGRDSVLYGGQVQTHWKLGSRVRFGAYGAFFDWVRADAIRAAQTASPALLSGSTNSNAATATQYASRFGILDLIGRMDLSTWSTRWPLMLQLNFASNTRACANLVNIPIASRPACNPRDRNGYWAEVQMGRLNEVKDVQFGYTFIRIEREAVLAAFNFSDLRSPTNLMTHRVNLGYQAYRNLGFSWTGLFGRQLVTATSPVREPVLRRMQFDVNYKF